MVRSDWLTVEKFEEFATRGVLLRGLIEEILGQEKVSLWLYTNGGVAGNDFLGSGNYVTMQPPSQPAEVVGITVTILGDTAAQFQSRIEAILDKWEREPVRSNPNWKNGEPVWLWPQPVVVCRRKPTGTVEVLHTNDRSIILHYARLETSIAYEVFRHTRASQPRESQWLYNAFGRMNTFVRQCC